MIAIISIPFGILGIVLLTFAAEAIRLGRVDYEMRGIEGSDQ